LASISLFGLLPKFANASDLTLTNQWQIFLPNFWQILVAKSLAWQILEANQVGPK
jgi:hypothetical protein